MFDNQKIDSLVNTEGSIDQGRIYSAKKGGDQFL